MRINIFRWGTKDPNSTGYRPIEWGDTTHRDMVARGYHVISPRRSAEGLSDEEYKILKDYGRYTVAGLAERYGAEADQKFRELLGRCPFLEPPAIDIDGKCKDQTSALKEIVNEAMRKYGLTPRWSYSGGAGRAGYHAEFGDFVDWPKDERSLRWRDALRAIFSNDSRLVAVGQKGFALVGGDPKNCIDLSPANGSQRSRGKIVRALGARYKAGSLDRKELCEGESINLYPVPVAFLSAVPTTKPAATRKQRADFAQKRKAAAKRYERRALEIPAGTRVLKNVAEVLKTIRKPGHNHELMMLLIPTIQERFLGADKNVWTATFQAGGLDGEDFRKIWDTTNARRKSKAPVKSTTQARQHLGAEVVGRLALALAQDLGCEYGDARSRLGYDAYQPHDLERLMKLKGLDSRIVARLKRLGMCKHIRHRCECGRCKKPQYQRDMPCDIKDNCPQCSLIEARKVESWIRERWAGEVVVGRKNFSKRQDGLDWAHKMQRKAATGQRCARMIVPELDGSWTLYTFAKRRTVGAGVAILTKNRQIMKSDDAAALAASLFMRPYEVLRALFRAGRLEEWVVLANRMLGAHAVTGAKNSSLSWPTQKQLKEIASEYANSVEVYINEDGEEVGPCGCAHDTPTTHTYFDKLTKTIIIKEARHPASLAEVAAYWSEMLDRGLVDEPSYDARTLYALRE